MAPDLRVLFRAAAGPRLGFGHLIRCRSLARALGVTPVVALRATARTHAVARRLGCELAGDGLQALRLGGQPSVLVVDDPSAEHAEVWVNAARRLAVPVATVHDLGLGYVPSDLNVDASVRPHPAMRRRSRDLRGPSYALLDPDIATWRAQRARLVEPGRVVVAFGGGSHVFGLASRLSDALAAVAPRVQLRVAAGFSDVGRLPALRHGEWIAPRHGLGAELAHAEIAVLAGGVSLYEACAVGTPAVALAVTPAQALTIGALSGAGAVLDGGHARDARLPSRLVGAVAHLLHDARLQRRLAATGRRLVDGRGVYRVADRVRALARVERSTPHAA